jgi:hypothetical protein
LSTICAAVRLGAATAKPPMALEAIYVATAQAAIRVNGVAPIRKI